MNNIQQAQLLETYQPWHAAKADMLTRAGKLQQAKRSYQRAIELTENEADLAFLREQHAKLLN